MKLLVLGSDSRFAAEARALEAGGLVRLVLAGEVSDGDTVEVAVKDGKLTLKVAARSAAG